MDCRAWGADFAVLSGLKRPGGSAKKKKLTRVGWEGGGAELRCELRSEPQSERS